MVWWLTALAVMSSAITAQHLYFSVGPQEQIAGNRRFQATATKHQLAKLEPYGITQDIEAYCQAHPDLPYGTMCSGTDSPCLVLGEFGDQLSAKGTVDFSPQHKFSAEKVPNKQRFINFLFDVPTIYNDMRPLFNGSGHCVLHKGAVMVAQILLLIAGFPCTTVSTLNTKHATEEHRTCIRTGKGATGECFHGILKFVLKYKPHCIILENVIGLLSNGMADDVIEMLTEAGYYVKCFVLSTIDFFLPQARKRLYFCCVLAEAVATMTKDAVLTKMQTTMDILKQNNPLLPLDEVLLPDEHPTVQEFKQVCANTSADKYMQQHLANFRQRAGKGKGLKWVDKSFMGSTSTTAASSDDQVAVGSVDSFNRFPALKLLPFRELDILMFLSPFLPEKKGRLLNLAFSSDYSNPCAIGEGESLTTRTITPRTEVFHTSKCRHILGLECLRLQGIFLDPYTENRISEAFGDTALASLAGNAFSTTCFEAALYTCFAVLGEAERVRCNSVQQTPAKRPKLDHHAE